MTAIAARLRARYAPQVADTRQGHTDDAPRVAGSSETPPPPTSGSSAEQWSASPMALPLPALPLPGVTPCDYCGGACTRRPRQGRVLCGSTCRSKARRWLAWASVSAEPYPGSSLWSRSRRQGLDDRPRRTRETVLSEAADVASLPDLLSLVAAVRRDVHGALRDGPVTVVWSVSRERLVRE